MVSILIAAVFAVAPFYKPPPHSGDSAPHVAHIHRRMERHRHFYSAGYIDSYGYYDPDASASDAADDEEPMRPAVMYRPVRPVRAVEENPTFPTFSTIVVKGAPLGNGCIYKAVMTDDEINTCKRAARNELSRAR